MDINMDVWLPVGIMGFVLLLMNGIFLGIIVATQRKMAQVSQWPSTLGTVNNSYLERRRSSKGGSVSYPVVEYSYQVQGRSYQGRKIAPGMEVGGTGAGRVVERYPAGAQVMVFYNPQDHTEAVLERKAQATWVMWLVLGIIDCSLCGVVPFILLAGQ